MPIAVQVIISMVFSLPINIFSAWDAVVSAQLAARLEAIRAAGDPVTMADLAKSYPDPPPGKNAATFFNAAFEKMDAQEELGEARLARLPLVGTAQLPPPEDELPAAMLGAIRAYLKDNAEVISLLHQAAALEECKFDLDFTKGPGMLLPHLARLRQGARMLALETIERTERKKGDEAADSLLACLRMGEAVRREPLLISTLVRIACDAIAAEQTARWASRANPSPKALQRLEAALAAAGDPRIIERAMVGERCFGIDIYQNYVLKPNRGEMLAALDGGQLQPAGQLLLHLIPAAYFKSDMICYLTIMNDYVAAARKPYPVAFAEGARVGRDLDERIPSLFLVSRMILPALGNTFAAAQKHIARCHTARVGLAALRYKARHGRLPDKLDALVPDFLDALPPDPFDGKPLRYRTDHDGFVVYTLGENGRDDGGLVEGHNKRPPDIGFRVRRPRAQF